MDYYESERGLWEYLLFHYGRPDEVLPWSFGPRDALDYPRRCVSECLDRARLGGSARGLDLGCSVGRSTFELARHCGEVIGIDFSANFVAAADRLRVDGRLPYQIVEEGGVTTPAVAEVPGDVDRGRVRFEVGDAQRVRASIGVFDVVLMANLIDRLRDPRRCLRQLPGLMRVGGQLIIASPYTWLEEYTPREEWLGGFIREDRRVHALEMLSELLAPGFELVKCVNLPFLLREHSRKYQWSVAEASLWIRK